MSKSSCLPQIASLLDAVQRPRFDLLGSPTADFSIIASAAHCWCTHRFARPSHIDGHGTYRDSIHRHLSAGRHLEDASALIYGVRSIFVLVDKLSEATVGSATRCDVQQVGPIPSMLPKQQVHAFAEAVAAELGYKPGEPLDLLLSKIGGRLAYRDLFDATMNADSIKVDPSGSFTIFVSGLTSEVRDRFTIAHELGHYFLHFPLVRRANPEAMMVATRWVDETNGDLRRAEWEANWFAAAFLMPLKPFKEALAAHDNDIREVALLFGVSLHAAEIRRNTI